MDIHVNDLVFEDGFKDVLLKDVSFRDIDQEFIFVRTEKSFDSEAVNILYYCFIKPYQGQVFRRIGETDEGSKKIYIDEAMTETEDVPYSEIENETISKIVENGDLISNQLIVNIPFDYYEDNDDLKDLMETRRVTWIDDKRIKGNPDWICVSIDGEDVRAKLIRVENEDLTIEAEDGRKYSYRNDESMSAL